MYIFMRGFTPSRRLAFGFPRSLLSGRTCIYGAVVTDIGGVYRFAAYVFERRACWRRPGQFCICKIIIHPVCCEQNVLKFQRLHKCYGDNVEFWALLLHRWLPYQSIHWCHRLPDTSATRHFGIKTLWDTSAPISRHFDTKNVVRDTSTRVPWSRKSRDTSTQDNSDETQLYR